MAAAKVAFEALPREEQEYYASKAALDRLTASEAQPPLENMLIPDDQLEGGPLGLSARNVVFPMTADALARFIGNRSLTKLGADFVQDCSSDLPAMEDTIFDEVNDELPCIGKCRMGLCDGVKDRGAPLSSSAATLMKHVRLAVKQASVKASEDDPMVLLKFVAGGAVSSSTQGVFFIWYHMRSASVTRCLRQSSSVCNLMRMVRICLWCCARLQNPRQAVLPFLGPTSPMRRTLSGRSLEFLLVGRFGRHPAA